MSVDPFTFTQMSNKTAAFYKGVLYAENQGVDVWGKKHAKACTSDDIFFHHLAIFPQHLKDRLKYTPIKKVSIKNRPTLRHTSFFFLILGRIRKLTCISVALVFRVLLQVFYDSIFVASHKPRGRFFFLFSSAAEIPKH